MMARPLQLVEVGVSSHDQAHGEAQEMGGRQGVESITG